MRSNRIYVPEHLSENSSIELSSEARRHLVQVLRLKSGDDFVLFDGSGATSARVCAE